MVSRLTPAAFLIFLLLFFSAFFLPARDAHAEDQTCDSTVRTRFELSYSASDPPGYRISAVTVYDIAGTCIGGQLIVLLTAGDQGAGSAGPVTVTGSEMVLPVFAAPRAEDVTKVTVQLSTLASIPPPEEEPGIDVPAAVSPQAPPSPEASQEPAVSQEQDEDFFGPILQGTPIQTGQAAVSPTPLSGSPTPVIVAQAPLPSPTPQVTAPPRSEEEKPKLKPSLVDNILGISDIATSPQAILSNAGLSAGLLALMLIDTTIFNAILKENAFIIHGFVQRRLGWLRAIFSAPSHLFGAPRRRTSILKPLLVLSMSALIYSLLDPDFGLNNTSLVLFLSLFFGLAVATYVNDGGQVFVAEQRFGIPFSMQFYPAAIGIALVSIAVSRLVDIHPGIIFGFVAGAREASRIEPDDRQDGLINYLPMLTLLFVSVGAWLAIGPVGSIAGGNTFIGTVVEASCAMLFVGSIQGLLFTLLPLQFMDGQKVWKWNKLAWLSIALPVGFLFFHTVLNQGATLASASSSHGVVALYVSAIAAWILTVVAWIYFRRVNPSGREIAAEEFEDVPL